MTPSPAYVLGVLDTLVKAGEMSPAYAAGVADVLVKEAAAASSSWYNPFDTQAENIQQQWNAYADRNPGSYNFATGQSTIDPEEAARVMDKARVFTSGFGDKASANMAHWWNSTKRFLNNPFSGGSNDGWLGKTMSPEESNRLREYEYNKIRLKQLQEAGGANVPAALQAALQDKMVRDAKYVYRDQQNYMSPEELKARFGEDEDDAAAQFRTPEGTAAMRGGSYKPKYDTQSAKPPAPSVNNNPLAHMYGNKDRNKLFTRSFRNGLGMY